MAVPTINVACPKCRVPLALPISLPAGFTFKCPRCGQLLTPPPAAVSPTQSVAAGAGIGPTLDFPARGSTFALQDGDCTPERRPHREPPRLPQMPPPLPYPSVSDTLGVSLEQHENQATILPPSATAIHHQSPSPTGTTTTRLKKQPRSSRIIQLALGMASLLVLGTGVAAGVKLLNNRARQEPVAQNEPPPTPEPAPKPITDMPVVEQPKDIPLVVEAKKEPPKKPRTASAAAAVR